MSGQTRTEQSRLDFETAHNIESPAFRHLQLQLYSNVAGMSDPAQFPEAAHFKFAVFR